MQYTFEISISGCSTECAHCYVGGGRSPSISFDNYTKAVINLKTILDKLNGTIHVTLGNEIFTHPKIADIVSFTNELMPEFYSYKGLDGYIPSTGMALINRKNNENVLTALKKADCSGFMITLHGNKEHHNEITKNNSAFDAIQKFAKWIVSEGFEIKINLMLNRFLIADWQAVCEFTAEHSGAAVELTIPLYIPVDRLRKFQKYRAEYDDCMKLKGKLAAVKINEENFFKKVNDHCEKNIYEKLMKTAGFHYTKEERKLPQWAFFNITQAFDIFYGNAGMHTRLLGNLLTDPPDELLQKISVLPPNYDWSAFYDIDKLPPVNSILHTIMPLNSNFVYSSLSDCMYSWLDKCGVPNMIMK